MVDSNVYVTLIEVTKI